MELLFESRSNIRGVWGKLYFRQAKPEILPEPVLVGDTNADGGTVECFGTVLRDQGMYRMWYQGWPRVEFGGGEIFLVGYAESDNGLDWRKPSLGIFDFHGQGTDNNLTDLGVLQPSVFIDPDAPPSHHYRATGHVMPWMYGSLAGAEKVGYYTAHSADGLSWEPDSPEPRWPPSGDNICAVYHPQQKRAIVILKFAPRLRGFQRRSHREAEFRNGVWSDSRIALVPDEFDDVCARARGHASEDYYGITLYPVGSSTVGFLWHLRHDLPRTVGTEYGVFGLVDVTLVFQEERGSPWLHVPGRPDFISHGERPWMAQALYTSACPVEVGDEHWLYFSGDAFSHAWYLDNNWNLSDKRNRQYLANGMKIGVARWPKFRLFGFQSDPEGGLALDLGEITEPCQLALNYSTILDGCVRVKLVIQEKGVEKPLPGHDEGDAVPLTGASLARTVAWRNGNVIAPLPGKRVHAHLLMDCATVYAYKLTPVGG